MDFLNAIAKARFASARPQRVQLHRRSGLLVELLCLEGGQEIRVDRGRWTYYVVAGSASLTVGRTTTALETGHLAAGADDEPHRLANAGDSRLVCLAISV